MLCATGRGVVDPRDDQDLLRQAPVSGVIAVLGGESTGKTTLSLALAHQLRQSLDCVVWDEVVWVPEYLRYWCQALQRTPLQQEQAMIAAMQTQWIDYARCLPETRWVVADTCSLMTAVYSWHYFGEESLFESAMRELRHVDAIVLAGDELPWCADAGQRSGPEHRTRVQQRLRSVLRNAGLPWQEVHGPLQHRVMQVLNWMREIGSA